MESRFSQKKVCARFKPRTRNFLTSHVMSLLRINQMKVTFSLLLTPLTPNQSRKLGGTTRGGGVQECAGSSPLSRSSLLGSNLPRTLANKHIHTCAHTNKTHTQKDRLYGEVKERSHPAGCWLSALLSMLTRTRLAFEAACRYDIFANIPHSFYRAFTNPERLLKASLGSPPSLVLYVSDTLQSFGGNLEEMSSTFSSLEKKMEPFSLKPAASLTRPDGSFVLASLASYTHCCLLI